MEKFYQWTNINEESAELYIYGTISSYKWSESDVTAYDLAKELSEQKGKKLLVRINSKGGEVSNGLAIYNLLRSHDAQVTTLCDGFACSAASVIFMAGSIRKMPRTSLLMIHNAWTYTSGDSNDLRKIADELEKITQPSVKIYKGASNLSEDEIKKMMDDETWINADEALSYGFVTEIVEDSANQSADDQMFVRFVNRYKQLEKENNKLNEKIKELEVPGHSDAWASFFNGGR